MTLKYGSGNDPYCYPGSSVLINRLGIRDEKLLENAESEITLFSAEEIDFSPPPYNLEYWKSIHRVLFQDLYDWAGEIRSVFITKGETRFCNPKYIEQEADRQLGGLAQRQYFVYLSRSELINKCAELFAELNLIHPFREGNGRAQRIFFEHILQNCGYAVEWDSVTADEWLWANIAGVAMNYTPLANIFERCISENTV